MFAGTAEDLLDHFMRVLLNGPYILRGQRGQSRAGPDGRGVTAQNIEVCGGFHL